jgi:hypothetical protein
LLVYDRYMFEGKLPLAQVAHDFGPDFGPDSTCDFGDATPLREMTWSDLRSRLEAARDLRASLQAVAAERLASFDAHSARHIAGLAECKHAVNPEDSANGKVDGRIEGLSADAGTHGGPAVDGASDPRK